MCTSHSGGHNLAKLIQVPSNETTQPECAWSGALTRRDTARPTERCHKGENGKRAARTCTRHPGSHNLEKLIWAPSNETTQTERTHSGDLTWLDTTCTTERCHKGENGKWAARICTRHTDIHNLTKMIRAPLKETTRTERVRSGDLTWHDTARSNERCHKGENGKRAA